MLTAVGGEKGGTLEKKELVGRGERGGMRGEIGEGAGEVVGSETALDGLEQLDESVFVGLVAALLVEDVGGDEVGEVSEVLFVVVVEELTLCGNVGEAAGDGVE